MTWSEEHGLARRITTASIPLILCGPILRRVELPLRQRLCRPQICPPSYLNHL